MHKPNLGISEKEVANRAKLGIISTKKIAEKGENMSEDGQKKFISKLTDALEEGRKRELSKALIWHMRNWCAEGLLQRG